LVKKIWNIWHKNYIIEFIFKKTFQWCNFYPVPQKLRGPSSYDIQVECGDEVAGLCHESRSEAFYPVRSRKMKDESLFLGLLFIAKRVSYWWNCVSGILVWARPILLLRALASRKAVDRSDSSFLAPHARDRSRAGLEHAPTLATNDLHAVLKTCPYLKNHHWSNT
jgi:hypothetical protein